MLTRVKLKMTDFENRARVVYVMNAKDIQNATNVSKGSFIVERYVTV